MSQDKVTDMASDHSDDTTESLRAAPLPPNNELDELIRDIMQVPYSKSKAKARLTTYISKQIIEELDNLLIGSLDYDDFVNRVIKRMERLRKLQEEQ